MKDKMVYIAGDLLNPGAQFEREQEAEIVREAGLELYSAKDNKEINDKQNQTKESNDGLAEKIVKQDLDKIIEANVITINPTPNAIGTMVETGQIHGMKVAFDMIELWIRENEDIEDDVYFNFIKEFKDKFDKIIVPMFRDIRRTDIPEQADRRSLGINQYLYGVVLALTKGHGFYEFEDLPKIMEDIEKGAFRHKKEGERY